MDFGDMDMVTSLFYKRRKDGKLRSKVVTSKYGSEYYVVIDDTVMDYWIVNNKTMRTYDKTHYEKYRSKKSNTGRIKNMRVLKTIIRRHLQHLGVKFKIIIRS